MTVYIGIDNGSSGSVAVLGLPSGPQYFQTPTVMVQDYTKAKKRISRLDHLKTLSWLQGVFVEARAHGLEVRAYLERPLVNPKMFTTTVVAVRVLEAWLVLLERVGIGYQFVDSREWQKKLLPAGTTGKADLKQASHDIGGRLYPQFAATIKKQKDADGLMIAHWAKISGL